jgi:tetratricopeptide (TPR) repeat protein
MRDWLSVPQQSDVVISSVGRATLSAVQDRLGLTAEKAQSIQERVVQPYRQLHQRKQQYRKAFAKEFHYGKPISPLQRQGLKRLQYVSGLTDAEVSDIEEKFTRQFGWLISLRANNLFSIKSAQIILWAATFIAALVAVVSLMPLRNSQPESSVYPSQDPFVENFSEPSKQELLKEGKESLNLGDFEDAISKFEKIVKQDPGQIEAYSSLAEAHLNLGEINSVIEVCNQAINNNNFEDSKLFKLYHLRGISYYKLGESDKLRRLSNFERSQRDLSKAINITENQSLETFKDKQEFASLYIDRAYTLLALNDFQAAIEDFNKAIIDLDSNDPRAYEGRGDARKNKNQLKKAEQDFTQARNILGEQGDQTSYVRVQKKIDQLQKRGSN